MNLNESFILDCTRLDIFWMFCLPRVGLSHLKLGKVYHFPDGPWVEYAGKVPPTELQSKMQELGLEVNNLISRGMKVYVASAAWLD
ncbi:hypothetical protein Hanom_Chr14g01321581 [Helianthus anomalus]